MAALSDENLFHNDEKSKSESRIENLKSCLLDIKNNSIAKRTHAAFLLRTDGSIEAAQAIAEGLKQRNDSELMRHELAYILGQMGHFQICPLLIDVLKDDSDNVIVRHESAEALGAIGYEPAIDVLKEYSSHPAPEISETCQIAIELINYKRQRENSNPEERSVDKRTFLSEDPAPPADISSISQLQRQLMDDRLSLFLRYRALFALRNINTDETALAIATGFSDKSALFRHEIAYVLGQMQRSVTIDSLCKVLKDLNEHAMVRHEAAEALGAIGGKHVEEVLSIFRNDEVQVVRESCEVALNIMDYWTDS